MKQKFHKGQVVRVSWGCHAKIKKCLGPKEYLGKTYIHYEVSGFDEDPLVLSENMLRRLNQREIGRK